MHKKLNRYARRKRDKKLDFIKGCHRKNFRLEKYTRTYNAFPIITRIERDTLHESRVRFPLELLKCWYPKYFEFKYVRNTWDEYPEWKYICIGYREQKYWDRPLFGRIKERKEIHVKNYNYYKTIQEKEWNKSNCYNKMELMTRDRHKVHTYLNNIKNEYNSGYEELTDDLLSDKIELFDKWDWRW